MHLEALGEANKDIFFRLNKLGEFYLAGGTALALQIGHRISVDFDLFSTEEISKNLLPKVKHVFDGKSVSPSVNNPDELTVFVDKTKLTFLFYPFPLLSKLIDYEGVKLLSVKEIAATKAYTIGRRGAYKDYLDLYFIISQNYASLNDIIETSEKKYRNEFNSRLFLEQLIYLEDVEDTQVTLLKESMPKEKLIVFFEEEIRKINL